HPNGRGDIDRWWNPRALLAVPCRHLACPSRAAARPNIWSQARLTRENKPPMPALHLPFWGELPHPSAAGNRDFGRAAECLRTVPDWPTRPSFPSVPQKTRSRLGTSRAALGGRHDGGSDASAGTGQAQVERKTAFEIR